MTNNVVIMSNHVVNMPNNVANIPNNVVTMLQIFLTMLHTTNLQILCKPRKLLFSSKYVNKSVDIYIMNCQTNYSVNENTLYQSHIYRI